MKKWIILILVIIVLITLLLITYFLNQYDSNTEANNANIINNNLPVADTTSTGNSIINNVEVEEDRWEKIMENDNLEIGTNLQRGFIIDNVYHSEIQGDIHFASYFPKNYDATRDYAIYFALPGWEGLYFQGVGANMGEPFPYEAQNYISDMIIISPQLDDWGEESANDTIALVEFF